MAQRDITQFPRVTNFNSNDLIHLGRDATVQPDAALRDVAIAGVDLFNAVNTMTGIFGAPTAPTSLSSNTLTHVTGFAAEHDPNSIADPSAGTITVFASGSYLVNVLLVFDMPTTNGFNIACFVRIGTGATYIPMSGVTVGKSQSGDIASFAGRTMLSLNAGDILGMYVESDLALGAISYFNGALDIQPVTLTAP
jgi:hypothetical protein